MTIERVRELADGRIYSGNQAKKFGLIDTLGTYQDALDYAVELAGLTGKPNILKEKRRKSSLLDLFFGDARDVLRVFDRVALPEYKLNLNF